MVQPQITKRTLIYKLVYLSKTSLLLTFLLIVSFSLQTVERAFAYDEEQTSNVVADDTLVRVTDSLLEMELAPAATAETDIEITDETNDEVIDASVTATPLVDEVVGGLIDESEVDDTETADDEAVTTESTTENEETDIVTDTEDVVDDTDDLETNDDAETTDVSVEESTAETDVASNTLASTTPSATTSTEATVSVGAIIESDSMIQFSKDNCIAVEDGSFYCQKTERKDDKIEDGLLSLPDADGDLEIYLRQSGELKQITHNLTDDASPYYDKISETIVWHRVVDDRYQIIIYDINDGGETQLTDTSGNNMEPFRAGNYIVWQYWFNNSWQIMLYESGQVTQLTNTSEHNLAPVIRNELVVWNRINQGTKTIEVFDIASGAYMTIEDTEGGSISNPRMVLVYDALLDNGDKVTRGYDLVTGELTSFTATPVSLPEEIPEPDATGETRALLSSKQVEEDEVVADNLITGANGNPDPDVGTAGSNVVASSTTLTLDLSLISEETSPVATSTSEIPTSTDWSATTTADIPDLIVPTLDLPSLNSDSVLE